MASDQEKHSLDRQIEENLRRIYRRSLDEDVPDRFKDLLAKLKAKEGSFAGEHQVEVAREEGSGS